MIKRIVRRMLCMCPEAWYIFKRGIQLAVFLLLCCLAVLTGMDEGSANRYELFMTASALNETAQAVLLISVLASIIIEDVST